MVQKQELLQFFGLSDACHLTLRLLRHPSGTFSQGATLTLGVGNEVCAAWLQHVAGDALAEASTKHCAAVGDILECILAFCQLSTERHDPTGGPRGLRYLTTAAASHIWKYIETGVRAYNGYYTQDATWMATFCPNCHQ